MKLRILIGLTLFLALVGCNRLTVQNYQQIKMGMTYDQVVQLIGKPDQCDDAMGFRSCNWADGDRSVHVNFAGDKVLFFASSNLK